MPAACYRLLIYCLYIIHVSVGCTSDMIEVLDFKIGLWFGNGNMIMSREG